MRKRKHREEVSGLSRATKTVRDTNETQLDLTLYPSVYGEAKIQHVESSFVLNFILLTGSKVGTLKIKTKLANLYQG